MKRLINSIDPDIRVALLVVLFVLVLAVRF